MQIGSMHFSEIWLVDFEFGAPPGERPKPVCLVAHEVHSGRKFRIWQDELLALEKPPYSIGHGSVLVAYYASAELGCHLSLNWPMPDKVLDLYVEFRNLTNEQETPCGNSLLGALTWFGLSGIEAAEKDAMRQLALRGGPWTPEEQRALLDYCESDVESLARLLPQMIPKLDMERALLRGRFMKAAAQIEHNGTPIDCDALSVLREHWTDIQDELIARIDASYGVYDGRSFKAARFETWLVANNIPWPRLASGALDLDDDTFREMARSHPTVSPLRELRTALSKMRLSELPVGHDGRNRTLLSAFGAKTGRNKPSSSEFIFGPAVWLRGLIRPEPGCGLAYIDWSQQEFGIAAALSRDRLMMEAYSSGDPYLALAKQAGAVPQDATEQSHRAQREQFKACVLAVQYGMGEVSLSYRIGQPVIVARELLRLHRETYRTFWKWSDGALDRAMLHGKLWTTFGWNIFTRTNPNPRSLRNFPMQANGAEMLRLACCLAVESGIKICAPVHDAILIEAPLDQLDRAIRITQEAMSDASALVLDGFRLRSDAKVFRYPERYMDERGTSMWETVWDILGDLTTCAPAHTPLCTSATLPVRQRTPVQSYIL
jgi:DNA polymerase I